MIRTEELVKLFFERAHRIVQLLDGHIIAENLKSSLK